MNISPETTNICLHKDVFYSAHTTDTENYS